MIAKTCACAGSIGCGLSFIDSHCVAPTRIGSTPIARNAGGVKWSSPNRLTGVSGSGADRSLIHSDERLVAHFDADQQHLVERVEDRDLEQDRQAAGGRIDLLRLVELQDFLLLALLVVLEALLDRLHLRLNLAHRGHRLELLLRDREHDRADDQRQADDRHAEIADGVEQEHQQVEDRPHEPFEPAPVDRLGKLGDAGILVAVEPGLFLGAGEQAAFASSASGPARRVAGASA